MHEYDYREKWKGLLTPDIVMMLTQIHEYKGEQNLFLRVKENDLLSFADIVRIQSVEASNRMEGICVDTAERLRKLVKDKTVPRTKNEEKIAGYRDMWNMIRDNYEHIPPKAAIILQIHSDLYKFEGCNIGGSFKDEDCSRSVETLCRTFQETLGTEVVDPLVLIPMFVLDLLCMHPFENGNERMGRLLMLLLLYRSGYTVGRYVSIEKLMESTEQAYDASLRASSLRWYENENDYKPFVKYVIMIVLSAYEECSSKINWMIMNDKSKTDRVRSLIQDTPGMITKAEILRKCPDISQITVQRTLADLVASGKVVKIGGGRYTKYEWAKDLQE